jgi:hemolysin activation/secretion protein
LASIKRFKVGGDRIGRGFEAAAVSGDRGLAAKVELRRRLSEEPNRRGNASTYGFYDLGAAWKNDIRGRESSASTGFGVSLRGQRLSGYLELATPLTHTDADGRKDAGIFAEVSLQF